MSDVTSLIWPVRDAGRPFCTYEICKRIIVGDASFRDTIVCDAEGSSYYMLRSHYEHSHADRKTMFCLPTRRGVYIDPDIERLSSHPIVRSIGLHVSFDIVTKPPSVSRDIDIPRDLPIDAIEVIGGRVTFMTPMCDPLAALACVYPLLSAVEKDRIAIRVRFSTSESRTMGGACDLDLLCRKISELGTTNTFLIPCDTGLTATGHAISCGYAPYEDPTKAITSLVEVISSVS